MNEHRFSVTRDGEEVTNPVVRIIAGVALAAVPLIILALIILGVVHLVGILR